MMTAPRTVPLDRVGTVCAVCGDLVTQIRWVVMTLDGRDDAHMVGESCACGDTITAMEINES